jgi:predicted TIM-barrel fold metal-dependent hydrolase
VLLADETAPDVTEQVARVRETPGIVGLRISTSWPPGNAERLRAGAYEAFLTAAEKYRVPVCVLGSGDLPDVGAVARAHPELVLIVDHLGLHQPPYLPVGDQPWGELDRLLDLAELPNVAVKLSGAPTLARTPYPFPDIWPHLDRVIDAFGVRRCMWGTDQHRVAGRLHGLDPVPRYPGHHSYAEGLHYLLDRTGLSPAEKTEIFGGTARRLLN